MSSKRRQKKASPNGEGGRRANGQKAQNIKMT